MLRDSADPFDRTWPAVAESVGEIRRAVVAYLRRADRGDLELADIQLAVSEAVSNAIVHGFSDREPGRVRVHITEDDGALRIEVDDDGRGMQPRTDSPGLGLGLPLIASVTERFETHAAPGRGTRLCLWFDERVAAGSA